MHQVPFNRITLQGGELANIREAVTNGKICGDGAFAKRCQALLEQTLGAYRVLLTTSCTHALEMAALLLDIKPGDEVIMPSFTFVSTANAFVLRGARPAFVDVRPDTLNMNELELEHLITPRSKVIVPVHYAGLGCEMEAIMEIGGRHGIPVVEDNAHGLFGKYKGKYLGTFGCLAAQSFHETKSFTCGEGGALVINDERYADRAEKLREKGTNRLSFLRGEVDKYSWVDLGSSYVLSDLLAAFLLAQLEARDRIQRKLRLVWETYFQDLRGWATDCGVMLPAVPSHCEPAHHLFYLVMNSVDQRNRFIAYLKARGIAAVFHYVPLHLSPMGRRLGGQKGQCPVTEDISGRLVRLPFHPGLTDAEQSRVVSTVLEFSE